MRVCWRRWRSAKYEHHFALIENLQKSVACHPAAFDFDMGFILQSVKLVAGLDLEHEVENGPPKKKRGRKNNLT